LDFKKKLDNPSKAVFRISASVVKQLGEELVSDELTAIMELVKNSYDADSDWVKITINIEGALSEEQLTFKNKKGYIVIEDSGDGMNYEDILNHWLYISVSQKKAMKEKGQLTAKKRTPLGDKGLGRLSTQRLGFILEMFSGKKGEVDRHHVAFDWRDFTESSSLDNIKTHYSNSKKDPSKKGTKLVITDLKNPEIWTGDLANKFRGQLSKLIFPFQEHRPFNVYLTINGERNDLDQINEKLRKQAIGRYSFSFDGKKLYIKGDLKFAKLQGNTSEKKDTFQRLIAKDKGKQFFSLLTHPLDNKKYFLSDIAYSNKNGIFFSFNRVFDLEKDIKTASIINKESQEREVANPGAFFGEIDEFNLSGTEEIGSAYDKLSEYKLLVKNQVGVRIFRNGFGIKPYGMEDNDWLKLSRSQTSGGSFYLLRPENVIGFVSITAEHNGNLVEKTDREGFIDNAYSKNFFTLIDISVSNINQILDRTRRSYDEYKKREAQSEGGISSFEDTKQRLLDTAKQSSEIDAEAKDVFNSIKKTYDKVNDAIIKIKNEPLFSSSVERNALKLLQEVNVLLDKANEIFEKITVILKNAMLLENDAHYLEPRIYELESQIVQFSELAGLGLTAEAFTHEMFNIIDRLNAQTDQITKVIKKDANIGAEYYVYAEHVKSFTTSIRKQLNHLAPSLKYNRESRQVINMSAFIKELQEFYKQKLDTKINFKIKITEDFEILANKGKLTQIMDNLILNSQYWLDEIIKTDKSFNAVISVEIKSQVVLIYDNGYGISPVVEQTLFQPFVTTKPKREGRGLGLYIVQQLLDSMEADIVLLNRKNEHNRKFIFQINFNAN
jgi:signal transduction histidine kinase